MTIAFEKDIKACIQTLEKGGTILYPTDTIWGIGCDATNENAVRKVYAVKQREENKSLIVLLADVRDIMKYVAAPDPVVFDFLEQQTRPTTIVFEGAIGLADNLAPDGSVAIRIVQDEFCRHLIKRFKKPIVSTSANISGEPSPENFNDIAPEIKETVDYIVKWRRDDTRSMLPSQIIRWNSNGNYTVIRS